ncbi:CNB1_1 [Blepharisma stoltei]|uniref:EF-hand domain-containing protein n=1 Tax=Blepharisma stoltei TaxID=1481888 RepID=A0AAU9JFA0_9CILI|nr:unnamed protein product [Blepharisma stoltei]
MGNAFRSQTEEDYIMELILLSNNSITAEEIYDTIMKTNYSAKELIGLYKRFSELDTQKRDALTNQQFLSMRELMYNPFRHRLRIAIPLKSEEYIKGLPLTEEEKKPLDEDVLFTKVQPKQPPPTASSKVAPEEEKSKKEPQENEKELNTVKMDFESVDFISYITFHQFCLYLTVFCPRTPIDTKITFLFKLYDFDGDGAISPQDLSLAIKTMTRENLSKLDIQEVVKYIFREVDIAEKGSIGREEFQKVLWLTDFYQKTSLYF